VVDSSDGFPTADPADLPPWLAAAWGEAEHDDLEWRWVDAARTGGVLRSVMGGRVDFPRLTYNDRFAVGPMSVYRGSWGDADVLHTRVLIDQVVRVSVSREVLPPWDFGPTSGDAIVLELVDGDCCAPLALVDSRRDVTASWVFLDTLIGFGIPVDDEVGGLLDTVEAPSAPVARASIAGESREPLWSLSGDDDGDGRRDADEGADRVWALILAEPPVTEPRLALPPSADPVPDAEEMPADAGTSRSREAVEHWGFVNARDDRSRWQRWTGRGASPPPLVYSSQRVVGEMAWTAAGWSTAVISQREVLLDDVVRIAVEPGVLHFLDRRTPRGDPLPLGSTGGDAIVLVLASGERCAPLALAQDGRDIDETAAFVAVLAQLAIPLDPAVRRLLAPGRGIDP